MTRTERAYPADLSQEYPFSEAVLSDDGVYRYVLTRRWGPGLVLPLIMLNPSTADAETDDPTIRRCCGFARREGCGGICVLNLYAMRSPNPSVLREAEWQGDLDPAGPENDSWLAGLTPENCELPVVAAWGSHPVAAARVPRVLEILAGMPLTCLGTNRNGSPRHPLYVRGDAPLVPYRPAVA